MGVWRSESTVITDAGLKLLSDIAGVRMLAFTKVVAGSDFTTPSELGALTDITHQQMELHFSEVGKDENGTAYVDIYLDNSAVVTPFYHQQIGIYAKDSSDTEVLFLVAQADSPDYIPEAAAPVYVTHRIFIKFSESEQIEIQVDFSGVVTQEVMNDALKRKEDAFNKNTAFNRNFCNTDSDYVTLGKKGYAGGSVMVARADHVHPVGTMLKMAENNWNTGGKTNLLPDTNTWVMSNGRNPTVWGGYQFEATFTGAWEGFSCFFSDTMLEKVRGNTIEFGVDYLTGASSRLELVVDGSSVNYILATESPTKVQVTVPETATSVTLRIIVFSTDDLHCKFEGIYMYDMKEEATASEDGKEVFLVVRKVLQEKLPTEGVSGTLYLTEKGNMYLVKDDGSLLPLGGSTKL